MTNAPNEPRPEASIGRTDALYRRLVNSLPAAVYTTDREGRINLYNEAAVELWGRRPEPGDRWCGSWKIYKPDGSPLPLDQCPMAVTLREGRAVVGEEIIVERSDGSRRHVLPHPSPLRDDSGAVVGAVNMLVDISERNRFDTARRSVERALRESETRFREVANTAPVMIWMSGLDTLRHWFNKRWLDFVGRSSDDERGLGWTHNVHPDDLARYLDMYSRAFVARTAFVMEYRLRRYDGEYRWIMAHGTPMVNADAEFTGFIGTCTDITERKHAEQERERLLHIAQEASAEAQTLNEVSRALNSELDLHKLVQLVTDAGTKLTLAKFGAFFYNLTDERGESYTLYTLSGAPREAFDRFGLPRNTAIFAPTFEGAGVVRYDDVTQQARYGRNAPHAGMPAGHLPVRSYLAAPVMSRTGAVLGGLFFGHPEPGIFTERAERLVTALAAQAAIAIDNAKLYQALEQTNANLEKRVEERTSELTASHERLRMSERLAMMGTLAAGLGHDMGNLLVPVRVRLDSLATQPLSDLAREDIDAIRTSADYLRRLATGLRMLALDPQRSHTTEVIDVADWWADAAGVLKSVLPRGISLISKLPAHVCRVRLSKAALTQAVFNLIQNAGDAMRERGSGTVTIEGSTAEGVVLLSVSDDGPGMSPEVQRRCMEPYFSTKARGISTGLGLVLVYGLVKEAGGSVTLASEPGRGTTFTISLPCAASGAAPAPAGARIALVNLKDNRMRSLVAGELRAMGFDVSPADQQPANAAPALIVTDDPGATADRSPIVLLADDTGAGAASGRIHAIGPRPGLAKIRETLRHAAHEGGDAREQCE